MHPVERDTRNGSESAPATASQSAVPASGPQERAATAPGTEAISAAEHPAPAPPADSPAAAQGRRILSTAFVRVGPDGDLTVELHNGQTLTLRNVVMRRKDYCGEQVLGGEAGVQYCGGYADVAAARAGSATVRDQPDLAGPGQVARSSAKND